MRYYFCIRSFGYPENFFRYFIRKILALIKYFQLSTLSAFAIDYENHLDSDTENRDSS